MCGYPYIRVGLRQGRCLWMRIVIVDDNAGFRRLARTLLEQEGFTVVGEAANGEGGIAASRGVAADVVLLDVNLPGESGFDIAARIAADPEGPAVVMISTHDASDYAGLAERSGARGFIAKDELSASAIARLAEAE